MSNLEKITRQRINAPDFAQPQKTNTTATITAIFSVLVLVSFVVAIALTNLPIKAV